MAPVISKKVYRTIRVVLVSPQSEILFLSLRVLAIFILLFSDSIYQMGSSPQNLIVFQDKAQKSVSDFINLQLSTYAFNMDQIMPLLHDNFWRLFMDTTSEDYFVGGIRLVQYNIQIDESCYYTPTNTKTVDYQRLLNSFVGNCNPYNQAKLSQAQPDILVKNNITYKNTYLYQNQTTGIIRNTITNLISTPTFGTYPLSGFIANLHFIDEADLSTQFSNLYQWADNNTMALAIQFNKYSQGYMFQFTLIFQQFSDFEYTVNTLNLSPFSSKTWNVFTVLLIFSNCFFLLKILLEGTIAPRPTQLLVFINSCLEIVFCTFCLIESSFQLSDLQAKTTQGQLCKIANSSWDYHGSFQYVNPCYDYMILDAAIQLQRYRLIFQGLVQFTIPFNLFWLYSYMKGQQLMIKYVNMIYRSTVQFFRLFLFRIIVYICWALAFHQCFRRNFQYYNKYSDSLFSFLIWNIPDNIDQWERAASFTGLYTNAIEVCIFLFLRCLVIVTLISFTSISIYAASDFEFDFRSDLSNNNLQTIINNLKRLEKFQKIHLGENEQNKSETVKLIAWLNRSIFPCEQIELDCREDHIKLQIFPNMSELSQFLKYLFQIKPQLLFKSNIYFRIIVDLESFDSLQGYQLQDELQIQHINLKRLLEMLKDKGSRVPLLINYTSRRPGDTELRVYYKIYPYFHLNNQNMDMQRDFIFNVDVKQWQKRFYVVDQEDNADYQEDESEIDPQN